MVSSYVELIVVREGRLSDFSCDSGVIAPLVDLTERRLSPLRTNNVSRLMAKYLW